MVWMFQCSYPHSWFGEHFYNHWYQLGIYANGINLDMHTKLVCKGSKILDTILDTYVQMDIPTQH
jgi:hypothetical protein